MSESAVPLRGKLENHSFPAVLRALLRERRDGCLTVACRAITRRLYLRGGMIIYGSSTERQDRLGEILIAQGKLSRADHKKYWEQSQAGNQLLGITLVVNGCITMSDLYQGVTAQVVTILDRLQKWRKGDYAFEEGREPTAGTVLLRIPLALYLRVDHDKKPAAKSLGPPAQPRTAGFDDDEELAVVIEEETTGAEAISAGAAREIERVSEVSFMVQELRKRLGQDPFALLGVAPEAGRSAVLAAYSRIAKRLRPDRLPESCTPDLRREADEVYREATAAIQAAEEQVRRKDDAVQVAAPSTVTAAQRARPASPEDDPSRQYFLKGRAWISRRNYWQAADALRQAVRLNPAEASYRQHLGLALIQTKRVQEAEEHLVEATRLEPNNPAHFVNLGRAYRAGRLYQKARRAFERAIRLDPRDECARGELNDLPEEPPPGGRAGSGGLLKKLFGKG